MCMSLRSRFADDWMFQEGNTEDFCQKIQTCLRQGRGARRRAREIACREFTVDAAVDDLLATYKSIVKDCTIGKSGKDI